MSEPRQILDKAGAIVGQLPDLPDERLLELFRQMIMIRSLDGRMLKLQRAGRVGFVGTATGLEASLVGAAGPLKKRDWMWSGLREGGAAITRGLPLCEYIAQMYGNSNDTAKGRQMCNHFQHKESNYPSWSSVIGTQITHGVGAAYASARRGEDVVHSIHFGDGASSSTSFHSGMNLAGVWQAPCVFVCVDNGWAISVSSAQQTAAECYADKAEAYGMPGVTVDGNDVLAVYEGMSQAVDRARSGGGPSLLVLKTYRMLGHSSSDDPSKYRDDAEVKFWAARDPIQRYEDFLIGKGLIDNEERTRQEQAIVEEIDAVIHEQEAAPPFPLRSLVEDVYSEVPRHLRVQFNRFLEVAERRGDATRGDGAFPL